MLLACNVFIDAFMEYPEQCFRHALLDLRQQQHDWRTWSLNRIYLHRLPWEVMKPLGGRALLEEEWVLKFYCSAPLPVLFFVTMDSMRLSPLLLISCLPCHDILCPWHVSHRLSHLFSLPIPWLLLVKYFITVTRKQHIPRVTILSSMVPG